jgi:hypothetical protein
MKTLTKTLKSLGLFGDSSPVANPAYQAAAKHFCEALAAQFLNHARDERFLREMHRDSLNVDSNFAAQIDKLRHAAAPDTGRWLNR